MFEGKQYSLTELFTAFNVWMKFVNTKGLEFDRDNMLYREVEYYYVFTFDEQTCFQFSFDDSMKFTLLRVGGEWTLTQIFRHFEDYMHESHPMVDLESVKWNDMFTYVEQWQHRVERQSKLLFHNNPLEQIECSELYTPLSKEEQEALQYLPIREQETLEDQKNYPPPNGTASPQKKRPRVETVIG